ncbi:SDR family NAD(P)-dependent oxidoreductase [Ktedonosporobacter rubrisoli]|nr:SDR family NAD(P)-dependent oxidoreductase [Ktedonosporobacter rubrisoli]
MDKKYIVITGCSSGFGRITALSLASRNWHVFATVRKEADRESLLAEATERGCQDNLSIIFCDITQHEQVRALAQQVEAQLGERMQIEGTPPLHALVNNAGTAFGAPIELIELDDLRSQFEINVIAHIDVTQALLPLLKAGRGTIINVSSVSGRISMPIVGAYSASKFALEALSDALRIELAPFGVRVVVIEPESSPTNIWQTSANQAAPHLNQHRNGPYSRLLTYSENMVKTSSQHGFPAQLFADTVSKILESRRPRAYYSIPFKASLVIALHRFAPNKLWDFALRCLLRW